MNNPFLTRIEKVRKGCFEGTLLVEKNVDLFYLTGLKLSAGSLLIQPSGSQLLVDSRYYEFCSRHSPVPLVLMDEKPPQIEGSYLGFDAEATSYLRFQELQKWGVPLQSLERPVAKVRMFKEPEEVDLLREAAQLGIEGFHFLKSQIAEGVTESQMALELEIFWKKKGAQGVAFNPIIAFGANSAMPHYRAQDTALKKGMPLLIDIGVLRKEYHSDMTRVLFFGESDSEIKKIYGIVAEAQAKALQLCRPGTLISDLDKAARNWIAEAGYGSFFGHSLGHGIGLEIHEAPTLRQKPPFGEMKLQPGMVITIEPGIYLPGLGGVRLEDTIVITHDGYENLTKISI